MKRDMDLIRDILVRAEAANWGQLHTRDFKLDGLEEHIVAKHFELMHEAGLIEANLYVLHEAGGAQNGRVLRITWDGYEFLDAVRDNTIYQKAKALTIEKTGGLMYEALKEVLFMIAKMSWGIVG